MSDQPVPVAILKKYWGYDTFRGVQEAIVKNVLDKRDTLAILPTGGGKSVCYQIPAVCFSGLTIVISPLIALMQDQVDGLKSRGISATFINSHLSFQEAERRWQNAEHGHYRLLYLAPERCDSDIFKARASRLNVQLLAVDEAHCISEWGPDFRPSYRRLAEAAEVMGRPPIIAVTATATPEVRKDIVEQLGLREPQIFVQGFDRKNIIPSVFHTPAKFEKLEEILKAVPGTSIVYVTTRRAAESWAERLSAAGFPAEAYHGGMSAVDRLDVQERWQRDETRVIVATNAFGMGIDKPNVRLVVHVNLPPSLEAFYQEAGRAGRDGKKAYSVLLFSDNDIADLRSFIEESRPTTKLIQQVYDSTLSMARIAIGSPASDPFTQDARKVAEVLKVSPLAVRAATETLLRNGIWEQVSLQDGHGLIRLQVSAEQLKAHADNVSSKRLSKFIQDVMRGVDVEAYQDWAELDLDALKRQTGLERVHLLRGLNFLEGHQLLWFLAPGEGERFRMSQARSKQVMLDFNALNKNRMQALHRFEAMVRYARGLTCRRHHLLAYFGESSPERCGRCDVCTGRHRPAVITQEDEAHLRAVLEHIRNDDPPEQWLVRDDIPLYRLYGLTDWLVNDGYIRPVDVLSQRFELTAKGDQFIKRYRH